MTNPKTPERVVVAERPGSQHYGKSFWIADLPDGGYVSLYADRAAVNTGSLEFWGRYYPATASGGVDWDNPNGDEYLLFALPAGRWTAFYAASLLDGDPVAVDRWVEKGKG